MSAVTATTTALRLTGVHARYQFLETIRIPIAVVGTAVFPALALLFFVTTQPFAQDPVPATAAVVQLAVFSVMSVCLFSYGVGVAEDRALPWDGYLRTLPAGPGPRLGGRVINGLAFALLGLLPLALIGWLLTAATLPLSRVAPTALGLLLAAVPLFAAGLAIGYSLPSKAALAVAQLLLLPLAVAGGLFFPPELFPGWLDALSTWLPTRAGRDAVVSAATGTGLPGGALAALAAWSVVLGALAVTAYRRDEGRRFR
jgi:ABC-2 type transport system permease protein